METHNPKALAARSWLGYGRWEAPYWFVGMEPGGKDADASYVTWWKRFHGAELIDCREHHLASNSTEWHRDNRPPTQPTWLQLIQLVLAYEGEPTSVDAARAYQQFRWGTLTGDTASLWTSAIHAKSHALSSSSHREERTSTIRERLIRYTPKFAVFYGTTDTGIYERVAGAPFTNGYAWSGSTLCVLVQHPTGGRPPLPGEWWVAKGREIRAVLESGGLPVPAQAAAIRTASSYSSDVIRLLIPGNPKQGKSRRRFGCYRDGMTVTEYEAEVRKRLGAVEAGKCKIDLKWDSDPKRGFIRLELGR